MKKQISTLISVVFALILALLQAGFVKTENVELAMIPQAERWINYSSPELIKKAKSVKDPLTRAVIYEIAGQFEGCMHSASLVSPKSIVVDRANITELRCAQKALDDEKISGAEMLSSINKIEKSQKLTKSKDKDFLLGLRLKTISQLVAKSQWKVVKPEIAKMFDREALMTKAQRGQFYSDVGDLMISDRKWNDAFTYFSRATDYDAGISIENKMKNVLPLVSKAVKEYYDANRVRVAVLQDAPLLVPSSEENELAYQAQMGLSKNDVPTAADALVQLIRKFPLSVKSKWAQDKLLEILSKEVERSRGAQGNSVNKGKIVKELLHLDADRMTDWGKILFDMQSYPEAAQLYGKAANDSENSVKAAKYIYMAARSYQLSLNYSKAKEYFKRLSSYYSMSNEFIDGCIQWALIDINEKNMSEAISHLEMARSRKLSNQQDLVSLFWLFRAYKQKGNELILMKKVAQDLVNRFPLTYYGLIAYNELNQKLPHFEIPNNKVEEKKLKLSLSQEEWKAVERAKVLFLAGLYDDASDELSLLTQRTLSMDEELYLASLYAQSLNYLKTFSFLSDIFDGNADARTMKNAKTLFPKEFWIHVSDDKKRAGVDPYLLLSVMRQESGFRDHAISRSNAIGLMQMIPPTAEDVKKQLGATTIEIPKDLFIPANNIIFCAYYLNELIQKFGGDVPTALASYNAGPTRIGLFMKAQGGTMHDTWVDELPLAETSFYVKSILKNYIYYRILYEGQTKLGTPPWLTVKD